MKKMLYLSLLFLFLFFPLVSANGNIVYVSAGSNLYKSVDSGQSFIIATNISSIGGGNGFNFTDASISNDGQYISGVIQNSSHMRIYYSSDSGSTFNFATNYIISVFSPTANADRVSSSSDGKYVVVSNPVGAIFDNLYYSSNYGVTFSSITIAGAGAGGVNTATISGNGSISYAGSSGTNLFKSTNAGASYSTIFTLGAGGWNGVSTNYNGTYVYATHTNGLKRSDNSGTSFTDVSGIGVNSIDVQVTTNGSCILTTTTAGAVKLSTNYGLNFTSTASVGNSRIVAITDDCLLLYTGDSNTFYTSTNGGTSFTSQSLTGKIYDISASSISQTNILTPPTISVSLVGTNQRLVGNTPYVFPAVTGSLIITGFYNVITNSSTNYASVTCDYAEQQLYFDNFQYDNLTANGWTFANEYGTAIFDANLGLSLYLNSTTGGSTTIFKQFTPTALTSKISYIVKPQGIDSVFPYTDDSYEILMDVGTSQGASVVPLLYRYNNTEQTMCISGFNPSEYEILCLPYDNSQYLTAEIYLSLTTQSYSAIFTNELNQNKYYSTEQNIYTTNANNIGRITIYPMGLIGIIGESNSYVDNINISTITLQTPLVLKTNQNVSVNGFLYTTGCDYSTLKCYQSRFYVQSQNVSTFNNYEDFNVCSTTNNQIISGSDAGASTINFLSADALSVTFKFGIVLATIILIMGCFIAVGFMNDSVNMSMVIGVVVSLMSLIFFTLIGWVASWVLIMLVVFAMATIFIVGNNKSVANG